MTPRTDHILWIERYSYAAEGKRILDGVSLSMAEGEFLSLIGPNGAGKTTLLKCILRINTGGSGAVFLRGETIEAFRPRELARIAGYVPQADGRSLPFTVEEFVRMGRYPYGGPFRRGGVEDDRAVRAALELTGMEPLAGRLIDTLSGGERQTAFIAAALAQETPLLLLDEPTAFLDPRHSADIHRILARINRERGTAVLSVTHDINAAALTSDRVAVMKDGRIAATGAPEEIMRGGVLPRVYGKPFLFVPHPETGIPVIVPEGRTR